MDVLITCVIILIIGLAVAPFFLLSGEFGARKAGKGDGTGPATPVPGAGDSPVLPKDQADSEGNDAVQGEEGPDEAADDNL